MIHFAIPSYKRGDSIKSKVLTTLENAGVSKESISVFVANEQEREDYEKHLRGEYRLVVGELGIGNQRTFINSWYPRGERVVSLDDDIDKFIVKEGNKVKMFEGDIVKLTESFFNMCDEHNVKFWGVPHTNNGMFMNHQAILGLRECSGGFYGEYAGDPEVSSRRSHCEDLEKTIKHYLKYGAIIRFNDIAIHQKYQAEGGVVESLGGKDGRAAVYQEVAESLLKEYPGIVIPKESKTEYGKIKLKNKTIKRLESPVFT